jgi:hypothetical protein
MLSKQALMLDLPDYELRITSLPDTADEGHRKSVYGIFNKATGVREAATDSLPLAFATAYGLQDQLAKLIQASQMEQAAKTTSGPEAPRIQ